MILMTNKMPGIAQRLIGFFAVSKPSVQWRIYPELIERVSEILALIAQGHTNEEIAEQFVLSLKIVRDYVSNIISCEAGVVINVTERRARLCYGNAHSP